MLNLGLHQGASLLSYTPQSALRLLASVSQERAPRTVETLWQICASLQAMGYPVVVLDGSTRETKTSPGLSDLLHQAPWQDNNVLHLGQLASSLTVIPAALGFAHLAELSQSRTDCPLQGLLPYFRSYGLMVLHAPVELLVQLLPRSQTSPLVFMQEGASQVLASYQQCKQMALFTGLTCTVAALVRERTSSARRRAFEALRTLQNCADRHLGGQLHTTTIHTGHAPDMQRLALQLLENAGVLEAGIENDMPTYDWMGGSPALYARSH